MPYSRDIINTKSEMNTRKTEVTVYILGNAHLYAIVPKK